jgi:hypothetical protein
MFWQRAMQVPLNFVQHGGSAALEPIIQMLAAQSESTNNPRHSRTNDAKRALVSIVYPQTIHGVTNGTAGQTTQKERQLQLFMKVAMSVRFFRSFLPCKWMGQRYIGWVRSVWFKSLGRPYDAHSSRSTCAKSAKSAKRGQITGKLAPTVTYLTSMAS